MKEPRSTPEASKTRRFTFSFEPRPPDPVSGGKGLKKPNSSDITLCLNALCDGDEQAADELLPLVYDELRRHAASRMSREGPDHTLQPTALVHEAWMRIVGDSQQRWENRAHFFGAAARAMRRILIESARRKTRLKRGGKQVKVDFDSVEIASSAPEEKLLLINEALEKLEMSDPLKAKVVLLKFFGGSTHQEVAEALGISERSVERHWAYAKSWLFTEIQSLR
ncbi:sigma-70 family RNA polymerase sigma factor [Pelagicoccus sp. SDUM812003]|uniref:sigma-70 family RNA polymerase sigma factor n=1 Tax=Pelagicoccus sp. SDUM812003 TaxID=3041267 RepID=UPI00280EADE2|nr:sigma-70 family RNA polymerase sigma factor [Pelagicoccus sp. SDUM812003]MDQ8205256.1 sigma-70 family RNA polymerase sigma factor [Pelagicoccus sp. SDUM812003]